jgi:hypothetical protein
VSGAFKLMIIAWTFKYLGGEPGGRYFRQTEHVGPFQIKH